MWYRQECWKESQLLRAILIKEIPKHKIILSFESLLVLACSTQICILLACSTQVLFLDMLYLYLEFTFYRW